MHLSGSFVPCCKVNQLIMETLCCLFGSTGFQNGFFASKRPNTLYFYKGSAILIMVYFVKILLLPGADGKYVQVCKTWLRCSLVSGGDHCFGSSHAGYRRGCKVGLPGSCPVSAKTCWYT